jgi:hypothetical protein
MKTQNQHSVTTTGSLFKIYRYNKKSRVHWFYGLIVALLIILFKHGRKISGPVSVILLRQEQRPQQVNTIIPAVYKWYVKEGDMVEAGDTILQLGNKR